MFIGHLVKATYALASSQLTSDRTEYSFLWAFYIYETKQSKSPWAHTQKREVSSSNL